MALLRKRATIAPNSAKLDDLMLMEILSRVASTKLVFRCKCVSKHWNSLIADRYFIGRFIDHHHGISVLDPDYLFLFFDYYSGALKSTVGFLASWDGEGTNQIDPILPWAGRYVIDRVECSFNDLLLCCNSLSRTYYIVNPFTKKRANLPIPPVPPKSLQGHRPKVGLVCEPFYIQGSGQLDLKIDYRYSVVRVIGFHRVEIYCSETRQWRVRRGRPYGSDYRCDSNIVAHEGKLYWYNRQSHKVVIYNPFAGTDEPCFHLLGFDGKVLPANRNFFLAKSQGSLLLMHFEHYMKMDRFSTWKLIKKGRHDDDEVLCFERNVVVSDFISDSTPAILRKSVANDNPTWVLGVHPNNQDIVFVGCHQSIISVGYYRLYQIVMYVNLKTKEWKLVGKMNKINSLNSELIQVALPWWPTPVH